MKKHLTRRSFLQKTLSIGGTTLMASLLPSGQAFFSTGKLRSEAMSERNILLLISDDHGIDQTGCYGNTIIQTPNIDRLADEGVRFTHAFTTAASCSPSRSSLLTGLYPHQNGQYGLAHRQHHFSMFDWVETMPTLLKRAKYRTGLIGKLHVEPHSLFHFDYEISSEEIMENRDVSKMAEKAGEFFRQKTQQPFFLLIGYSDPHRLKRKDFGNKQTYPGIVPRSYDPGDVIVPDFLPDIPEVREELADMYESITRLDTGVGMVLKELQNSGQYESTLILYLSDNGIPFPGAKTNLYDAGVRVPLIIRFPGVKRRYVSAAVISFIDLLPTVLEWTGVSRPEYPLPGRSFLSILDERNPQGWDEVYFSHSFHQVTMNYPMRALRTSRYKYILNLFPELEFPGASDLIASKTWQGIVDRKLEWMGARRVETYLKRPKEELYDIERDPHEVNNLSTDSHSSEILIELRNRLTKMRTNTDDPWLEVEDYQSH
ncbi:MAG: sulfatase [Gemmatimonadota bacterium]|nr:MAG: sulfatase [Gemmatimonadota bacterium]